jgi:NAD(P)-dependent dehydrogenase (short-subunit alcohol dehydrogenase family)
MGSKTARFADKLAIVLGVSDETSIGGAVAGRLIQEGAKVIIAARTAEKVDAVASKIGAVGEVCEIANEDQVSELADKAIERYGHLDVGVNCVGQALMGYIESTSEELLRQAVDVHLIGPFFFIKHMARVMERGGAIATMSSVTATLTFENHAAYMAAKAGTDHLVRTAAVEYGHRNIRVNSVTPGFTDTPMTNALLSLPGVRDAFEKEVPLGRLSTIEDIAAATAWVCSDEAYITGQNLQINGGLSLRRLPTMKELDLG